MVNENRDLHATANRKGPIIAGMVAVVVVILLLIWWVFSSDEQQEPEPMPGPTEQTQPEPQVQEEAPPEVEEEPATEEPEAVVEEPLPPLGESDEAVREELQSLAPDQEVNRMVTQDNLVRKVVRAITALQEGALVNKYRPVEGPDTEFRTEPVEGEQTEDEPQQYRMTEENFARYQPYVNMLLQLEAADVARLYGRYYPLLEEAYLEQGVDKGNFRQVTVQAIDFLLQAPEPRTDVLLVRPSVMYKFADPRMEELPGAHKLMLRMGPENSRRVKQKLRELRSAIANG